MEVVRLGSCANPQVVEEGGRPLPACRPEDQYLFGVDTLPGEDREEKEARLMRAIQLCWACPIRDRCLQDALDRDDRGMIRGGRGIMPKTSGPIQVREVEDLSFAPYRGDEIYARARQARQARRAPRPAPKRRRGARVDGVGCAA